jgi:benzoate/toluate 1,2-dioxygenase alpha subunit
MPGVISAGMRNEDEGLFNVQHGYWQSVMQEAAETEAEWQAAGADV